MPGHLGAADPASERPAEDAGQVCLTDPARLWKAGLLARRACASCPAESLLIVLRIPLFSHLSFGVASLVAMRSSVHAFEAGAEVLKLDEPCSDLFVLLTGRAERTIARSPGKEIVVDLVLPGEHFGEVSILDQEGQGTTVRCVQSSRVLRISKSVLPERLPADKVLTFKLLCGLCDKVRRSQDLIRILSAKSIPIKLRERLLWLERRERFSLYPTSRMTRTQLAKWLGVSRESVSRAIVDLESEGTFPSAARWRLSKGT